MNNSLNGQVAWITGGGSGIGLAGAIELARAGAHVVISGRNPETTLAAEKTLRTHGSAEAILLDVADKHAVQRVAEQVLAKLGRIDILVNSAGINTRERSLDNISLDDWDNVIAINLSGLLRGARGAARHEVAWWRAHCQCGIVGGTASGTA